MATEIELKAWAGYPQAVKARLDALGRYKGAFEKEDAYWFLRGTGPETAAGLPPSGVRVRKQRTAAADGGERRRVLVTYKTKELRDGMEINDEREFEIAPSPEGDSPGEDSAAPFEELLIRLGLEKGIAKRKKGWSWDCDGITAELTEVEGLGWFVELEIIAADRSPDTVAGARSRLLDLLDRSGIKREAIERRYYTEMLRQKEVWTIE